MPLPPPELPTPRLPLLITGITGVAGYNAFHYFRRRYPGRVVGTRPRRTWRLTGPGVVVLDAEDAGGLRELFRTHRFGSVLNAVGNCALKSCELDPAMARTVNVASAASVVAAARAHGARLVHLSSDLVFSGTGAGGHLETDPVDPVTVYGATMVQGEGVIAGGDPSAALLRISLPMGVSFNGHAGAIDWIQSRFRAGRPATLYFDEVRSCAYTDDLNRVFERFLAGDEAGLYHAGGPRPITLYQIAQVVNRAGGYDPALLKGCPRIEAGPLPPRAGNVSMSSARLTALFGRDPFRAWPVGDDLWPTDRRWHFERPPGEGGGPGRITERLYHYPGSFVPSRARTLSPLPQELARRGRAAWAGGGRSVEAVAPELLRGADPEVRSMQWCCPRCETPVSAAADSGQPVLCSRCGQPAEPYPSANGSGTVRGGRTPAPSLPVPTLPLEPTVSQARDTTPPTRIGRYEVREVLGEGGFGTVYLAYDHELNRPVAIKVPVAGQLGSENQITSLLKEAQIAAGLRHPGIVTIYDVGRLGNGDCYFVMEYVQGQTLGQDVTRGPLTAAHIGRLMHELAAALHYAHEKGLVHRDLKPSNILIDVAGHPRITDFGLALEERVRHRRTGEVAGTPAYMAPEQIRGETHRLDGRTDLWSLGVVLYELLTGERPFAGRREAVFDNILQRDPRPPRQVNPAVSRELERICLKCLAKRMSDRYPTAHALCDDLRHFLGGAGALSVLSTVEVKADPLDQSSRLSVRVLPKGLRPFDVQDANYFLHLLPGARDRNGLPDSVALWKARLEDTDAEQTFSVGLIYGPSGCGKTSLVRAGLLPRLASHVTAIYVEATADDTEARLLRGLLKACPDLPPSLGLVPALAALRRGEGSEPRRKVVVVIDQFEQWLHGHRDAHDPELARALRQCDGGRVQCVLLVRDDFWMAISGFFRDLEVPLNEGKNSGAVDRFGARHARKVLARFGRAFDCLPELAEGMTAGQAEFLDQAVAELAADGAIIPVHLSLFAEMVKARAWVPATLRDLGGTRGLGVTFLEETFSSSAAPPAHRRHERAARAVLKALLPEGGSDIKGAQRSREELLQASGYEGRLQDFDDLLRVLDSELRLVTPADPEAGGPAYQLTHDYLVPSLREWLTRKQKETWRGRAELLLQGRAAQWARSRDSRFLLSLKEYLAVRLGVPRKRRTAEQQALVRAAGRRHGLVWAGLLAALLVSAVCVQRFLASVQHANRLNRAEALVEAVLRSSPEAVPRGVEDLRPLRDLAVPMLRARFEDTSRDSRHRLHAAVALAAFGEVKEDYLLDSIATAPASEGQNVLAALALDREAATARVRERLAKEQDPHVRLRLAATLLQLGDPAAARDFLAYRADPADRVAFIHDFASWRGDLTGLPALMRDSDDPALRSGLCAAVGMISPDLLDEAQQQRLQEVFRELYAGAADSSTHSAAGWALRKWGGRAPEPPVGEAGREWFVNRHGLTMLAVAKGKFTEGDFETDGARLRGVTITRPFFLCDREVTLDQFRRFLADPDPDVEKPAGWVAPEEKIVPSGDCPVVMVSWEDCLLFCNWLSCREGRKPCYERTGEKTKGKAGDKEVEVDLWRCDFGADGYRLPTEAEWEYACRAGTVTRWSSGDDDSQLASFAVFHQRHAAPGGTKLPNNWGLFDMHGNVREWCWDAYLTGYPPGEVVDPTGVPAAIDHLHRGGSWWDYPHACRSGFRNISPSNLRDNVVGFRVACGVLARPDGGGGAPLP